MWVKISFRKGGFRGIYVPALLVQHNGQMIPTTFNRARIRPGQLHLSPSATTGAAGQAVATVTPLDSGLRRKDELDHSDSVHQGRNCRTP